MSTRYAVLTGLLLAAAAFVCTYWLYPSLPERIPTHWNIRGEVDGWGPKPWAPFVSPGFMVVFVTLIGLLPWLSPRHFKVDAFRGSFNYVMIVCVLLMGYVQAIMLRTALHPEAPSARWLVAGIFLFFAAVGNVLGKVRRNFWMGVRTPWTLASETVWVATHRLAARLFVAAGVIGAVAIVLGVSMLLAFVFLMAAALAPVVYSLVLSKRLEREERSRTA